MSSRNVGCGMTTKVHSSFKGKGYAFTEGNCQNCFCPRLKRDLLCKHDGGSKFFSNRLAPFSEGDWYAEKQTEGHKSCLPCENGSQFSRCIHLP